MKALLVLPDWRVEDTAFSRCLASIEVNFPGTEVAVECAPGMAGIHAHLGVPLLEGYPPDMAERFSFVAFIEDGYTTRAARLAQSLPDNHPLGVYRFSFHHTYLRARMEPMRPGRLQDIYPHADAHIFNRLAPAGSEFWYYFPYGYLFRSLGLGPVNEFGFRVPGDLKSLSGRPARHKLICLFGGSSAWSLDCLTTEMFSTVLERRLNQWADETGRDIQFTVLNFGMHGHVVLNEILTYMLFVQKLQPDIVIAHDGFNDLQYGLTSDPGLLVREQICYQVNFEEWSQILHGTGEHPTGRTPGDMLELRNAPQSSIKAYITRKRQFAALVSADGARFLWGLQPMLVSKSALHPDEQLYLRQENPYEKSFGGLYASMKQVYDLMIRNVPHIKFVDFINFDEYFKNLDGSECQFVDFIHTTPRGEEIIADLYYNYIIGRIIGQLPTTSSDAMLTGE